MAGSHLGTVSTPLARLRAFVTKAKTIDHNTPMAKAWAAMFELQEGNLSQLLRSIGQVAQLVSEAEFSIRKMEGYQHELYLRPIHKLKNALLQVNLGTTWHSILHLFDNEFDYSLSVAADVVDKTVVVRSLDSARLAEIYEQLHSLLEEIKDAGLPEELTAFLIELLAQVQSALRNYEILGEKPLREAVESAIGALMIRGADIVQYMDRPVVKKTLSVLKSIASLYSIVKVGKELTEGARNILDAMN